MSEPTRAVFLSYASQDAEAAQRICEALRAAGIEVWFDQSELRGGDVWDQKIRRQVRDCALFIPVISANTASRHEGYFRLEWDLADQRTHMMARDRAFIVPVCIDGTPDSGTDVPESFARAQWSRLPGGETPPAFVARVSHLLSPRQANAPAQTRPSAKRDPAPRQPAPSPAASRQTQRVLLLIAAVAIIGVGYFAVDKFILSKRRAADRQTSTLTSQSTAPRQTAIPEKSIAVLPFADMSEKKDQEYFSDGLTEELIDLLSQVHDLRVPARTSSFYFKGKSEDIATIAQKLRVAHLLEGSVRKAGNTIRVTAQLIRADNGYHLWSKTYDRDFKDIFKVQDEIAGAVVQALKLTLFASTAQGARTTNVDAYSLLLQGRFLLQRRTEADARLAIQILQRAVSLDPAYAPAWVELSHVYILLAEWVDMSTPEQPMELARAAAQKALALDPTSVAAHLALADVKAHYDFDGKGVAAEIAAARRIDPETIIPFVLTLFTGCNAEACYDQIIRNLSGALDHDPLNAQDYYRRAFFRYARGELEGAEADSRHALQLSPSLVAGYSLLTRILIARHELTEVLSIAANDVGLYRRAGLALAYQALGRHAEADAALRELVANDANGGAYQIAEVCGARGDTFAALDWLERGYRQRDAGVVYMGADPLFKSLVNEPRYKAMLRKMNLPE